MRYFASSWLALLVVAGCFAPAPADHLYRCTSPSQCPSGYDCAADDFCYRKGHLPAIDMSASVGDGSSTSTTCGDNKLDGDETGIDCGGSSCSTRCADGLGCNAGSDCTSGVCNRVTFVCVSDDCSDGMRDDLESDVDCGGGKCVGCAAGKACGSPGDCANFLCNQTAHQCVSDPCFDGVKDFSETDVDCGGSCVQKCKNGQMCNGAVDCVSGAICPSSTCQIAHCVDGMTDNGETDLDCGGVDCSPCAVGLMCASGSDCASTFCNASTHLCVSSQCQDGVLNGQESDIDCGGPLCSKCGDTKMCSGGDDCSGAICKSDKTCCTSTNACTSGAACGQGVDNCGQVMNCGPNAGGCADGNHFCENGCCAATQALACGSFQCGSISDGCSGSYDCGSYAGGCASGSTCSGAPNYLCCQGVTAACTGHNPCDVVSTSCGMVTCPGCAAGQRCYGGSCCTPIACEPSCESGATDGCGKACPVHSCTLGCCGDDCCANAKYGCSLCE